ncbi:MAG: hypothetical protein AAFR51_01275 [Pseudomonadota bacterium]
MAKIVLFWILLGGTGFAFALAVQMRMMIALVLRRALKAWRPVFEDRGLANQAVILAARDEASNEASDEQDADVNGDVHAAAQHLRATYPNPLNHLRTARRYSVVTPVLVLALFAFGRFGLGVI